MKDGFIEYAISSSKLQSGETASKAMTSNGHLSGIVVAHTLPRTTYEHDHFYDFRLCRKSGMEDDTKY